MFKLLKAVLASMGEGLAFADAAEMLSDKQKMQTLNRGETAYPQPAKQIQTVSPHSAYDLQQAMLVYAVE